MTIFCRASLISSKFLGLIILHSYLTAAFFPVINNPNYIFDLWGLAGDYIDAKPAMDAWAITGFVSSSKRISVCSFSSQYLFIGGPEMMENTGTMSRLYTGIGSHNIIYFATRIVFNGDWQSTDWASISFDGRVPFYFAPGATVRNKWSGTCTSVTGNLNVQSMSTFIVGKVLHSGQNVTVRLAWNFTGTSSPAASVGFKDLSMLFTMSQNGDTEGAQLTLVDPSLSYSTNCTEDEYYDTSSSSCKSCYVACSNCFGGANNQCYSINYNCYFDGTRAYDSSVNPPSCISPAGIGTNKCNWCESYKALRPDGTCGSCLSPYVSYGEGQCHMCLLPCNSTQYMAWNGTCIDHCSSALISGTDSSGKTCSYPCGLSPDVYLYWNGSCLPTCPLSPRIENLYQFCDACPSGFYQYDNGTCLSSCQTGFNSVNIGDSWFCFYPCTATQFLSDNNTCIDSCLSPYVTKQQASVNFCDAPCSALGSGQYLYQNNSCLAACPLPYIIEQVDTNFAKCNSPCLTSTDYYDSQTGSCSHSCALPAKMIQQGAIRLCILPACPNNCATCSDLQTCAVCSPGYAIIDGSCKVCSEGYYAYESACYKQSSLTPPALTEKGYVLSSYLITFITHDSDVVESSVTNVLEKGIYDLFVVLGCFILLAIYVASQKHRMDSQGRLYSKNTGACVGSLKGFYEEMQTLASLYWIIYPFYLCIKAHPSQFSADYKNLLDTNSQIVLFLTLFWIAKHVKIRYFQRLLESHISSQRIIVKNWRMFTQAILIIMLISVIQTLLPTNLHRSFRKNLLGNIIYYALSYVCIEQSMKWLVNRFLLDFLPLFSNSGLTHYVRDCKEYGKAEVFLMDDTQLSEKLMHDVRGQKHQHSVALVPVQRRESTDEVRYLVMPKDESSGAKEVNFQVKLYRDKTEISLFLKQTHKYRGKNIDHSLTSTPNDLNDNFSLHFESTPLNMRQSVLRTHRLRSRIYKGFSKQDFCFFVPDATNASYLKLSEVILVDLNSSSQVSWKLQDEESCLLAFSAEKQTLVMTRFHLHSYDNIQIQITHLKKRKGQWLTRRCILARPLSSTSSNFIDKESVLSAISSAYYEAQMIEHRFRRMKRKDARVKLDKSAVISINASVYRKQHGLHVWSPLVHLIKYILRIMCCLGSQKERKVFVEKEV